jgi:hypothetical protein
MTWYFFFSTAAALYYFICVKLQQRAQALHDWLEETWHTHSNIEDFYKKYNHHYVIIQRFGRYWNFIIFLGIILLTFHIPIDLISIVYDKNYYDIYGFVIKTTSLAWYIYSICHLNDYETRVLPFLYKHRLYSMADMEMITKYVEYRPLGLPFYGIKINSGFFIKLILLMANLVIPSIYSLVSKNIINISRPV